MKPEEAKVLEVLHKTTLAYLSDKQYAEVVEAVEKQGILGLTGAASILVKGAVIKHGSHNQASHGRRGGGGSASPSSRIDPFTGKPTNDPRGINPYTGLTFQQEVDNKISDIKDKARDLTNELEKNPQNNPARDYARRATYNMRDSLDRASSAKTADETKKHLKIARSKIPNIVEELEQENYNNEAARLGMLGVNITTVLTMITRGK